MIKYFGREDTTLTVYVTSDCLNNCKFCTSKKVYTNVKCDIVKITQNIRHCLDNYHIKNVVLTGGEPFNDEIDLMILFGCLSTLKLQYKFNLYINTTLPKEKESFIHNVFSKFSNCIDGVSISRHGLNNRGFKNEVLDDDDLFNLFDIYPDISFRINCVVTNDYTEGVIAGIVDRWRDIKLNFREDYSKETIDTLHTLTDEQLLRYAWLSPVYTGGCYACATFKTKYDNVTIHKGLENTSHRGWFLGIEYLEIIDLVIDPNGGLYTDWDLKTELDGDNINSLEPMAERFNDIGRYLENNQLDLYDVINKINSYPLPSRLSCYDYNSSRGIGSSCGFTCGCDLSC